MRVKLTKEIRGVEADLAPDEEAPGWLREALEEFAASRSGEAPTQDVAPGDEEEAVTNLLAPEVQQFIEAKTLPTQRGLAYDYLREVLNWAEMEAVRGQSSVREDGGTRYVHLRRRGFRGGAIGYFWPRRMSVRLRLPAEAAEGGSFARARNLRHETPYQVVVRLRSADAVREAIQLTRQAYEAASPDA